MRLCNACGPMDMPIRNIEMNMIKQISFSKQPTPSSFTVFLISENGTKWSSLLNLSQRNHHFRYESPKWPVNWSPHSHSYFLLNYSSHHKCDLFKGNAAMLLFHRFALRPNHPQRKAFPDSPAERRPPSPNTI